MAMCCVKIATSEQAKSMSISTPAHLTSFLPYVTHEVLLLWVISTSYVIKRVIFSAILLERWWFNSQVYEIFQCCYQPGWPRLGDQELQIQWCSRRCSSQNSPHCQGGWCGEIDPFLCTQCITQPQENLYQRRVQLSQVKGGLFHYKRIIEYMLKKVLFNTFQTVEMLYMVKCIL